MPAVEPTQARINEKARQRTRTRLMRAARSVMGGKGIEANAINNITEEAELSFGSFYNYFASKEEVARAVSIEDALAMIEELDLGTSPEADIAERVGVNIRRTIHRGLTDPVWGWFPGIVNTTSPAHDGQGDIGVFCLSVQGLLVADFCLLRTATVDQGCVKTFLSTLDSSTHLSKHRVLGELSLQFK